MTNLESTVRKTLKQYGETDPRFLNEMSAKVLKAIDKNLAAGTIERADEKVIGRLCFMVIDSYY